jgi:hypothetical protein
MEMSRKAFSGIDNMTAGQGGTPGHAPLMITQSSSGAAANRDRRTVAEKPYVYQTMKSRTFEMLEKAISETFEDFLVDEETANKRKEAKLKADEAKKKEKEDAKVIIIPLPSIN